MKARSLINVSTNTLFLFISIIIFVEAIDQPEVKFVSVVFRHGDRAPDAVELYPKDPHYTDTFYPQGIGGLTNNGKIREFQFGEKLRDKYRDFLGDIYLPETVSATSTDYRRTKMSLQLVLSSLYPPRGVQVWNDKLDWQPIPITYRSSAEDWLMIPEECPEYLRERNKAINLPEIVKKLKSFQKFMDKLTVLTGKNISTLNDMYNLYHLLVAESSMNIELPSWTKNVFPRGQLYDAIITWYKLFSYTTTMRRLNGGKLIHEILREMQASINGTGTEKKLKISLYSGHETNVAAILQTLGMYKPHVPEYASAVIFELYKIMDKHYIKLYHYLGKSSNLVTLKIPYNSEHCPLDEFVKLFRDVIPTDNELKCDKSDKSIKKIGEQYPGDDHQPS